MPLTQKQTARRQRRAIAILSAILAISTMTLMYWLLPETLMLLYIGLTGGMTLGTVVYALHACLANPEPESSSRGSILEQAEVIVQAAVSRYQPDA